MTAKIKYALLIVLAGWLLSCKSNSSEDPGNDRAAEVVTPVTVTHIRQGPLSDNILLNATSVFQKKSIITSNVNGYIQKEFVSPGQTVNIGQLLFIIETKEARAIGKQLVDTALHFNGVVKIKAAQSGYISGLDHQQGDYVIDGGRLCTISDQGSFAFILDVPFELTAYVKPGHHCDIILPDGRYIPGLISSRIPAVDPVTQTQQFIVRVSLGLHLPENLVARVSITKSINKNATVLPKSALLTNEAQTEWWVMKMINDSTAVKVPVKQGLESDTSVQIISPQFADTDRILISGNYGLGDTALVNVQ